MKRSIMVIGNAIDVAMTPRSSKVPQGMACVVYLQAVVVPLNRDICLRGLSGHLAYSVFPLPGFKHA